MLLFTRAFWATAAENALQVGATTLASSGIFTGGAPTAHSWIAAGTAAGLAILYQLVKSVGAVQSAKAAAAKTVASPAKTV